jgi:hypothetical protein
MPEFKFQVTRTQIQTVEFCVEAASKKSLEDKLNNIDFGEIDERFDEGEVVSIDYDVEEIEKISPADAFSNFASEELKELID